MYSNGPKIVTDGLVLCLDAGNPKSYPGSGTIWTDISRNGNNGTLTNGPTFNTANGGGIVFDGANDYVEIPNSASLNPTGAVTLCSFFRINGFSSNYGPIIFKKNTRSGNYEQYSLFVGTNVFGVTISNTSGAQVGVTTPYTYGTLTFATAVINVSGASMTLYRNGIFQAGTTLGISFDISTEPLRIGAMPVIYTGYANGTIHTAQVYNRALSATEILQNYNATKGRFKL